MFAIWLAYAAAVFGLAWLSGCPAPIPVAQEGNAAIFYDGRHICTVDLKIEGECLGYSPADLLEGTWVACETYQESESGVSIIVKTSTGAR